MQGALLFGCSKKIICCQKTIFLYFDILINFYLSLTGIFSIVSCLTCLISYYSSFFKSVMGGGIQGIKNMKQHPTRKNLMIHGKEVKNHNLRGMTRVFGTMMNSSSWRPIDHHFFVRDVHLGKRRFHWTPNMLIKRQLSQSK